MRRVAVVIVCASGVAEACPPTSYVARVGTLSPAAHCGEWIAVARDANASVAVAQLGAEFDLSLRWQQLDGHDATLQLRVPGGYLLVRDGQIGLYTSEAEWAERGFVPLPHRRTTTAMTVRVRGHGDRIEAWIDGATAGTWTVRTRSVADVEVGIVGTHARLWFGDVVIGTTP
jgi:hypothetical protein